MAWSNKIVRVTRIVGDQPPYVSISSNDGKNFRMPEYWNMGNRRTTIQILDNFVYQGRLRFLSAGFARGGISHGYFQMDDGCCVQMTAKALCKEIPKMRDGVTEGSFTWKKIGDSINIYRVEDTTLEQ